MNSRIRNIACVGCLAVLLSCTGEEETQTRIELFQPDVMRQGLAYDPDLWVEVRINGGTSQWFPVNDAAPIVELSGVRLNDDNEITIRWIERVDERHIHLSVQSQLFFADGNTTIDAPHNFGRFDADGDLVSNFDERVAGTCVWSSSASCESLPPGSTHPQNLLINGDFALAADDNWFARGESLFSSGGEYCMTHSGGTEYWNSYIAYSPFLSISGYLNYHASFDIKADSNSTAQFNLNDEENSYYNILSREVSVSTEYERKNIYFTPTDNWSTVRFGINFDAPDDVRYCIDNVEFGRRP